MSVQEITKNIRLTLHALVWKDEELLLIRRSEDERYGSGMWDVPGGGIDTQMSVTESLRREVREEVGLEIEIGHPFYVHKDYEAHLDMHILTIFYASKRKSGNVILSNEHTEFVWVSCKELESYVAQMVDSLRHALPHSPR